MRILVTRPQPGAARTAARLTALGFDPVVLPLAEVTFDPDALSAAIDARWSCLAVTSVNGASALERSAGAVARWRSLPLFAVGRRTAAHAAGAGFTDIRTGDGDGPALADLVVATRARGGIEPGAGAPLLYCAGRPRAGAFEARLIEATLPYSAIECYRMEEIDHPPDVLVRKLAGRPFAAALFYSRASAENLFRLLAKAGLSETFRCDRILCLSERVADGVPVHFRLVTAVAEQPTEAGLLEMLDGSVA